MKTLEVRATVRCESAADVVQEALICGIKAAVVPAEEYEPQVDDLEVVVVEDSRSAEVAVVRVAAYMAVCKHEGCKWKMRYNGKPEAERFAGLHEQQRHKEA